MTICPKLPQDSRHWQHAHAERDAGAVELVHLVALGCAAASRRKNQLQLARAANEQVCRAVLVPERVPVAHTSLDFMGV